jgi:hypothetical protein
LINAQQEWQTKKRKKEFEKEDRNEKVCPLEPQHVDRDKSGCNPLRILFLKKNSVFDDLLGGKK